METIYDPALRLDAWWDPALVVEGWFDEEFGDSGVTRNGPTFVAASSANSGTGTSSSFSLTLPAGISDGDYAYMAISMNTQNDRGDPAGWTQLDFSVEGTTLQQKVYRKSMLASESSTAVTFTLSNAQKWAAAVVIVHNDGGVDTDTEIWSIGSGSTAWTAGAVTPTADDTLLVCFHAARKGATGTLTETSPTGWTERADDSVNAAASPSISIGAHTQDVYGGNGVSSGADTDGTVSSSASNQLSFVLAVKPVSSGTPATASGSITLGGSASAAGAVTAAGSLTLGGSATARAAATAAGSITLGGSATGQAPATASGSITLGGSATAQGAVTASGSVTLGGTATAQAAATASGSITLAGSATAVDSTGSTASGSITLGGSATAQAATTASGSITLGGSATARAAATATGSITLGGTATGQAPLTATGSITLAGTGTARAAVTASGSVTLGATATAAARATATGSITLTATADASAGSLTIPGFARETFPAGTRTTVTFTGTTARDTVRAGTSVRFGGSGARTHEFTPSHVTAKEPQHV